MRFIYTGDPRSDEDQPTATMVSRRDPQRIYTFVLNGEAVEVHEDDVPLFQGNRHFKVALKPPVKKKAAKKKAKKATKKKR